MPRTYNLLQFPTERGMAPQEGRESTRLGQDRSGRAELWAEAFIIVSAGGTGEAWSASQIAHVPTLVSMVSMNGFSGPWIMGLSVGVGYLDLR